MEEETTLILLPPQDDLPLGRTYRCSACGARLRNGQLHTADQPHPHTTFAALLVAAPEDAC